MLDTVGLRTQQQRADRDGLGDGWAWGKANLGVFRFRRDAGKGGSAGNYGSSGAGEALLGCEVAVEPVVPKSRRWWDGTETHAILGRHRGYL